ncbi:MAG: oligosaccharide flippase family protein [Bacteroidia bacterium]|nr:oligosaccharide flippase family protein [Bacteroidia bacterium]
MQFFTRISALQKKYKSLVESILSLSFLQLANMILPLITLPYLVKTLGVDKYGIYVFAYSVCNYFATIIDYGFKLTGTRDVALNRNNPKALSAIISKILYSKLLFTIVSLIILSATIPFFNRYNESYSIFYFSFLVVLFTSFFPDWFFQGIEKMRFITILNLSSRLIFTIAIFIFIKSPGDYILVPLIGAIGGLIAMIGAWWIILVQMKLSFIRQKTSEIVKTIKESTPLFLNSLFPTLYNNTSAFLLGIFGTPAQLAYYGAAQRIVEAIGTSAVRILTQAFFPYLNVQKGQSKAVGKIFFFSGLLLAVFFIISAPWIVKYLFTEEFKQSVWLIRIIGLSVLFFAINDNYGTNYLLVNRQDKLLMRISMVVSFIGLSVAFPLIFFFKHWGAAFTILFSRMLFACVVFYFARRIELSTKSN